MKIQEYSMLEFIRNKREYSVPFYQREYTWSEENVGELIDDVIDNEAEQYFLGSVVLTYKDNIYRIVDGQQRISSSLLILKCLSEIIDDYDLKYTVRVKFGSKNIVDGDVLQYIIDDKKEILSNHDNSQYYKNYKFIKNKLSNLDAQYLYDKFKNVMVSYVEVDDKTDEHKLFAQINSTGKQLSAFDLTKNLVFGEINDIESQNIYLAKLHNALSTIETKRYDTVLRQFRAYEYGDLVNKEKMKIYHSIKELYFEKYEGNSIIFLNMLIEYLNYYTFIKNQDSFDSEFYKELIIILKSFDTFSTLLIDIFRENSDYLNGKITFNTTQRKEIIDSLKVLQIYKIRREFVNLKEKEITRAIPLIKSRIKDIDEDSYSAKLVALLLKIANEQNAQYRMPLKSEFEQAFVNYPIYNTQKIARAVLERIELCKTKERFDFSKFTIEHMMPQTLTPAWTEMLDDNTHAIFLHTIGNLSLTCSNSELSNHNFDTKRLLMNENTRLYISSLFSNYDTWNTKAIKDRAKTLLEILNNEFPIEDKYDKLIPHEPVIDDIINKNTLNKNKSYFKMLKVIDENLIAEILYNYCVNGYSTNQNEKAVFGLDKHGWMSQSIYDYLNLPWKVYKGNLDDDEFDELLGDLQEKIVMLVREISDIIEEGIRKDW